MLTTSCGDLTFWPKHQYKVWKFLALLTAGVMICASLRAGDTPQTPLILSLPLAQLALWDTKSTDGFVEQLQGNKTGKKKQTPWSQEQINHARFLFSRLQRDKITIKKTFPALLAKAQPAERSILCRKCLHYFQHAGTGEISTTGGLTSMVKRPKHIDDFVQQSLSSIRSVARSSPLSAITSMYNNKGFPTDCQKVTDYLGREYWWQNEGDKKIQDRELLRTFSSMFNGRGLPEARDVKAYLDQDIWWQQEDNKKIQDRELLRAFSSMFSGRGLPKVQVVRNFLDLDVWWQQEGDKKTLDRELLRTFSSMFHGRGLPEVQEVKGYLDLEYWWQQAGDKKILDRALLRVFSSMFNGRGLPKVQEVKAYLDLELWWQQAGDQKIVDRGLLRVFSSMFSGRGLPKIQEVKNYLDLNVWWHKEGDKKILERGVLWAFSSMFNGKGLPDIRQTQALLDWLSVDGQPDRRTVHLMGSLYSGCYKRHGALGAPELKRLKKYTHNLCARLQHHPETGGSEVKDGGLNPVRIKQVALYLANKGGTRHLPWLDCVAFLDRLPPGWSHNPLETLYAMLRLQGGGPGVQVWLSVLKAGVPEVAHTFLLRAMMQGVPLATARYAVDHINLHDWHEYITVTRQFNRRLDSREWTSLKGYLRPQHNPLQWWDLQVFYPTLVQRFPENKRETFLAAESRQAVLKSLPTAHMMTRLAKACSDEELLDVFQACLDYYQAMESRNIPPFRTLSTLFHALLKIQSPFYLRPPQMLSGQALSNIEDDPDCDSGVGISINSDAGIHGTEFLVWQFLVKVLDVLNAIEYKTDSHQITLYPHGSDRQQTFLIPQLAEGSSGLYIRNWLRDDLLRFFRMTGWDGSFNKWSGEVRDSRPVYEPCREQHCQWQQEPARPGTTDETPAVVSQWIGLQQEKAARVMDKDPLLWSSDEDIWNTLFDDSDDW